MKKTILTFCVTLLLGMLAASPAFARHKYGAAGCGLGGLIIGDKPGPIQIAAAILNAIGVQTSAITSGTSNCDKDGTPNAMLMVEDFVALNGANVERDVAAGGGEYLSSVSLLLGCVQGTEETFGKVAQQNHARIFTLDADSRTVVEHLRVVIAEDATLVQACRVSS